MRLDPDVATELEALRYEESNLTRGELAAAIALIDVQMSNLQTKLALLSDEVAAVHTENVNTYAAIGLELKTLMSCLFDVPKVDPDPERGRRWPVM